MSKSKKSTFAELVRSAYNDDVFDTIEVNYLGKLRDYKSANVKRAMLNERYPGVFPTVYHLSAMARNRNLYKKDVNDFIDLYICDYCGERPVKFDGRNSTGKRYKTCGRRECASGLRKRTNMEKGNSECALHRKDIQEKIKSTLLKRYGVDIAAHSPIVCRKMEQACEERYGVRRPFMSGVIRRKAIRNAFIAKEAQARLEEREWINNITQNYSWNHIERDKIIRKEIEEFLKEHGIKYHCDFILFPNMFHIYRDKRDKISSYKILLVSPELSQMKFPRKRIGNGSLPREYFHDMQMEHEGHDHFVNIIMSHEWMCPRTRDILKSHILQDLYKPVYKFYKDDYIVEEFKNSDTRDFQEKNCIRGFRQGATYTVCLTLKRACMGFPAGTIIGILTLGFNFRGLGETEAEIYRMEYMKYAQVSGGRRALIKRAFFDNPDLKKLIYHQDLAHRCGYGYGLTKDNGYSYKRTQFSYIVYCLETMRSYGKKTANHDVVMEQIALGRMIAVPIAGTKTFEILPPAT